MVIQKKRKTRMYEPWGYREQEAYQSDINEVNIDLDGFFAKVNYNRDDNKIHFGNRFGKEVGYLDVNEFVKSDSIVEEAKYEDGKIIVKFTNGDVITIDVEELLDENEFKDGLKVEEGQVFVKIDSETEKSYVTQIPYLTVSENGVKVEGVNLAVETEKNRAVAEETRLDEKIDQEISDRIADVNAEELRAKTEEHRLDDRVNLLNDELDAEESIRESNDAALGLRITTETNDRISAVLAEKQRAEAAEQALGNSIASEASRATNAEISLNEKISQETERAIAKEEELDNRIDEIISGSPVERLDELIEKLGYKDNDTLVTTNEHEVAFGEWNVSNTDVEASGQTVFSVGIGTSAHDRKNAIEVMKDGNVFMWIEGEYMNVNKLLAQISHEVYDTNP